MKKSVLCWTCGLAILFGSCRNGTDTVTTADERPLKGALAISIAKSAIPSEVISLVAILEREGYQPIRDSLPVFSMTDTSMMQIDDIPAGNWRLDLLAKDEAGFALYSGNADVMIMEDFVSRVVVYMNPSGNGTGSLQVFIIWGRDSTAWRMAPANPVLSQSASGWDANYTYLARGWVIKVGNKYEMWYHTGVDNIISIAYANSLDGINWTKEGIVLANGPSGSMTEYGHGSPAVLFDNGTYKMWTEMKNRTSPHSGIGYSTSSDGINWTMASMPAIATDSINEEVFGPAILKKNEMYYLYYSVSYKEKNATLYKINVATSTDGTSWNNHTEILRPRPGIQWEAMGVFTPAVIDCGNIIQMYYTALSNGIFSIGLAESENGLAWIRNSNQPELEAKDTAPWNTSLLGYASVIKDDEKLKMWFSAIPLFSNSWKIGYAEK
jgi:predicted GH43/DUF377 family glycosyl hydrolase